MLLLRKTATDDKTSPKKTKDDDTVKKGDSKAEVIFEQLFKKGAGGLKKTEPRYMAIEGTKIKYARKADDLKGSKGVKSIELKGAIISTDKDGNGKFWIRIKNKGNTRDIATKDADTRSKWVKLLESASGGADGKKSDAPASSKKEKTATPAADKGKTDKQPKEADKKDTPAASAKSPKDGDKNVAKTADAKSPKDDPKKQLSKPDNAKPTKSPKDKESSSDSDKQKKSPSGGAKKPEPAKPKDKKEDDDEEDEDDEDEEDDEEDDDEEEEDDEDEEEDDEEEEEDDEEEEDEEEDDEE